MRLRCFALAVASVAMLAPARAEPVTTPFRCGGNGGIAAMENEYAEQTTKGACWFHLGHHTYDMRSLFHVGRVVGSVFSVEVTLSPPTDLAPPNAALTLEASVDGLAWTSITQLPYNLRLERQQIDFDVDAAGVVARYLRIRQPRSATQGLSGYLDSSNFDAALTPANDASPATSPAARSLTCAQHILERFFDTHPCWFGGINRYDAPSVFHTYPIGASAISGLSGAATFFPWRTDDYTQGGGSRTAITGYVQTSVDGVHWSTAITISGEYGTPIAFAADFAQPRNASYVRIVAEYIKAVRQDPALKHVRGMLLDSSITVEA